MWIMIINNLLMIITSYYIIIILLWSYHVINKPNSAASTACLARTFSAPSTPAPSKGQARQWDLSGHNKYLYINCVCIHIICMYTYMYIYIYTYIHNICINIYACIHTRNVITYVHCACFHVSSCFHQHEDGNNHVHTRPEISVIWTTNSLLLLQHLIA